MSDDNIIGIDGREAAQLRTDQAAREKREEILRQKLKIVGFVLQPGNAPGTYTAHPHPPQPPYLKGWRDLSLEQVDDATSDIERTSSYANHRGSRGVAKGWASGAASILRCAKWGLRCPG
jgi:hypothetical protein